MYFYKKANKIRHISLDIDSESEELIEFVILDNDIQQSKTAFCNGCSSDYYMHLSDRNYEVATKVKNLFTSLDDYIESNNFKIKILFKSPNIKYRITIYEDRTTASNIYYQNDFISDTQMRELTITDFESTPYAFSEEIIKYEEDLNYHLFDKVKEYSYRDKYVLYYTDLKMYYPTYEEHIDGYLKDENDFIIETSFFYKEPVVIKDKIVITNNDYDLNDYIKTNLSYEIASNIDISKNGKYTIKYIFDSKTIETEVEVKTNDEYIKDLENKIKNKNQEVLDVISIKNETIERLESNLKSKDEIISKKEVKTIVKKVNIVPVILITMGVMVILFCVYKSINKLSNQKNS